MTPAVLELQRLAAHALRGYRESPEWDDLLQEGLIGAWQAVERCRGRYAASTLAVWGARHAAREYLRSRASRQPRRRAGHVPAPLFLELDALALEHGESAGYEAPDEYEAARERLWLEQFWAAAGERLPARSLYVLRQLACGQEQKEVARRLGVHPSRVFQIRKGAMAAMAGWVAGRP